MAKPVAKKKPKSPFADLNSAHWNEVKEHWITPRGRSNYVSLDRRSVHKDKKNDPKEKGAFVISLCFPPTVDLTPLKDAANEAGREFGYKGYDVDNPKTMKGLKSPFIDPVDKGIAFTDAEGEEIDMEGWTMVRFNTYESQPVCRDGTDGNAVIDADEIGVTCYSGRWFRVMAKAKGYDNVGKGVKFWLEGVQALRHDLKFGNFGVGDDGEDFGAVEDDEEDDLDI